MDLEEAAMTSTIQDQSSVRTSRENEGPRLLTRDLWGAVSIVAMWVAVLFVGVYGGEATFHSVDSSVTTIPSGVLVAIFAAIGTASVAKRVFGRKQV